MEGFVTKLEHIVKVVLFDCENCGDCSLFEMAYLCPMSQCLKKQRNGACGGSFEGWCEVVYRTRRSAFTSGPMHGSKSTARRRPSGKPMRLRATGISTRPPRGSTSTSAATTSASGSGCPRCQSQNKKAINQGGPRKRAFLVYGSCAIFAFILESHRVSTLHVVIKSP